MKTLAPSILAADFSKLESEIKSVTRVGVEYLHIDVMDGHFVPNISIGPAVIKSLRKVSGLVFDVHLMVSEPAFLIPSIISAGADIVNVHLEACQNLSSTLEVIKGAVPAVTISPSTAVEAVFPYLDQVKMVLVMSVVPGFGGQEFMPEALQRISRLSDEIKRRGLSVDIEVDGGIDLTNISQVAAAGADIIVAGTAIFAVQDRSKAINELLSRAK